MDTSIARHFTNLPDPRIDRCKLHKLIDIVTIAICAMISNADGWEDIEAYGHAKEALLRTFLELPNGIPSHDTCERVFARLDPIAFQTAFLGWVTEMRTKLPDDVIAIDGKTLRGSRDTPVNLSPIHMVSAWCSTNALVLGQLRTADKSNEITAIPLLLDVLDIAGCTITIDAMGCQTAIAEKIMQKEADYVIACKGNQELLQDDVIALFAAELQQPVEQTKLAYHKTIAADHGRREVREYWTTDHLETLRTRARWVGLQSVAMVRSERQTHTGTSVETRYFISSLPNDVQKTAHAIRAHWTIENQVHWVLDVVLHEDANRTRVDHTAQNLSVVRHMTLNMLRQETSFKTSLRQKRLRAGWDDAYMLKVLHAKPAPKVAQM